MDIMLRSALRRYNGLRAQLDRNLLGDDGEQWDKQLKKFLRREPTWVIPALPAPTAFERNQHGHVIVTLVGLDLTGEQEVERLLAANYRVSDWAKLCFTSTKPDSYDAKHRLVAGQVYKFALMPGKEIERNSDRTTENLRKRGMEHYGYGKPLAGGIPRIRELVSDKQMKEMGFWYIAGLHDPIEDSDGGPYVLRANRVDRGRWVGAGIDRPDGKWGGSGAFAFLVPASNT